MLKAEEARRLCANWEAKRAEEVKKEASKRIDLLSETIAKEAAEGKHSFSCAWSVTKWGGEEVRNLVEKTIREAGYKMGISRSSCLITW